MCRVCCAVLVAVFFVAAPQVSEAQTLPFELGLKGGFTVSTAAVDGDVDPAALSGSMGGLTLGHRLSERWALQTEMLYNQRGVRDESEAVEGVRRGIDFVVGYIDVPLLLRYDFAGTAIVTPYVYGGPSVSFRVRERISVAQPPFTPQRPDDMQFPGQPPPSSVDVPDQAFSGRDYGVNIGAGGAVDVGFGHLLMEARLYAGFSDNDRAGNQLQNRSVTIMAGFRL